MKKAYEYIILGCGGIGSAALYQLSREAGGEVLGLEQFSAGHDRGGSDDHSRIIRLSYHDPAYTALTPHAFEAWHELERESGIQLLFKTGGLNLEPVEDEPHYVNLYAGALQYAGIAYEDLSASEVMERFPQFHLEDNVRAVYQEDAGLVDARKANAVHVALARGNGATVLERAPVREIRAAVDGVEVETDEGTFSAKRLVVTAGAWTREVLRLVGIEMPITVTREQVTYFQTPHLREFAPDRFPVWVWHGGPEYSFYGLPVYGEVATKAGEDVGGEVVTADDRTFETNEISLSKLKAFLSEQIPGFLGPELYTKTCLYDMPPDREFVLGTLPGMPQVIVANGAGHGFKFAALLGKVLSELTLHGETGYPIEKFDPSRPALTDPAYEPVFAL